MQVSLVFEVLVEGLEDGETQTGEYMENRNIVGIDFAKVDP